MALHIVRGRTIAESLKERMDYTENDLKTEEKKYISTYGCDIETADEEFLLSQQQYGLLLSNDILQIESYGYMLLLFEYCS